MLSALHKGDKDATRHNEYEKQNNEKVAKMSKKKKMFRTPQPTANQ